MNPITVNDALSRHWELDGSCIPVEGILKFEFENISLSHWPKAERKEGLASSIWIEPDGAAFDFNPSVLERWSGKRVVVLGVFGPGKEHRDPEWNISFGQFSLWPAEIRARRIDLRKRWLKDHPEIGDSGQGVPPAP